MRATPVGQAAKALDSPFANCYTFFTLPTRPPFRRVKRGNERGKPMALKQDSAARKDKTTAGGAELQHRHFAFIAATLANLPLFEPGTSRASKFSQRAMAEHFADACAHTNPKFDRARFLRACGAVS